MTAEIKILVVDDHQIVLDGICAILSNLQNTSVVATANNGQKAVDYVSNSEVDVVIMDIDMPVMNGLEATEILKNKKPHVKILTLSMHDERSIIQKAIDAGADGYILKNSSQQELQKGIETVMNGSKYFSSDVTMSLINQSEYLKSTSASSELKELTEREIEVLGLIAEGLSNKEVAEKLFISHRTVDTHRTNLMKKLEVHNVAGLIKIAIKNGLVE